MVLVVVGRGLAVDGIRLQGAVGSDLFEVQLVPKGATHLGTLFPQEERADHTIARGHADARLEAAVEIGLGVVDLGARHCHGLCGGGRGQAKERDHHQLAGCLVGEHAHTMSFRPVFSKVGGRGSPRNAK
jgi:hypothetical protein